MRDGTSRMSVKTPCCSAHQMASLSELLCRDRGFANHASNMSTLIRVVRDLNFEILGFAGLI